MLSALAEPIIHAIIAVCLIAAYAALRWHGVDEPLLLGILGGQLGALGVSNIAQSYSTGKPAVAAPVRVVNPPPPTVQ